MGRKHLLDDLLPHPKPSGVSDPAAARELHTVALPPRPIVAGALGAVSKSLEHLKSNAIIEIDPDVIEPSLFNDRLESDESQQRELLESIRLSGQQVPILVRPHPIRSDRYQIAYGRRRLRAVKELGRKVRALVRTMSDEDLVLAQGQENSARTDLSFIEKAMFASRLVQAGYSRDVVSSALTCDKTVLSRWLTLTERVPATIIEAIGPAPSAGRDRWGEFSTCLRNRGAVERVQSILSDTEVRRLPSDARFLRALQAAKVEAAALPSVVNLVSSRGLSFGTYTLDGTKMLVRFDLRRHPEFGAFAAKVLPRLFDDFVAQAGDAPVSRSVETTHAGGNDV